MSGGGAGHEPMHGGFVGQGMLDAAACGEVFTSPVPDQILAATSGVDGGVGVLHIVKNYTGDVMNFDMAAELAEDTRVESVIVADDVAVEDSSFTAGRRGVGGTVFVERLAGAAAAEGRDLDGVVAVARKAAESCRSMGAALTSGTLPAHGKPSFQLGEDELELGVGIHGEPGRSREPMAPAAEIARKLTEPVLAEIPSGQPVIAMLNGATAGIGLVHALYCDLRFAADSAVFTTAFARRGLIAEHGISWMLPRIVGHANALDLLMSARRVSAAEALRIGLVNRLSSPEKLREDTYAYARDLADFVSPSAIAVIKRQVYDVPFQTLAEATIDANREMQIALKGNDFREGVASFVEKRPPRFTGT